MRYLPVLFCLGAMVTPIRADEGMWLFNEFPKHRVKKDFGVDVTDEFLTRLRLASVRLSVGGSGSFVSPDGLIFTNHHVARECIQKVSTAEHNYIRDGFYAATRADEKACPGSEINIVEGIHDVTKRVNEGISESTDRAEAGQKRRANIAQIEKECVAAHGGRCDVVTLYSGGAYHLYRFKKYTDVRLVFAPEEAIAFFGGDPDNFTYPRYDYDISFLRAYENGKPLSTPNFLPFSKTGVKNGELAFVSGNPGSTGRLATYTELEFSRDLSYPLSIDQLKQLEGVLLKFSAASEENARVASDLLFGIQNSIKARSGFLGGLRDPKLMQRKLASEKELRAKVDSKQDFQKKYGNIWDDVAKAYAELKQFYAPYLLLEARGALGSDLMASARHLVRMHAEKQKPNGQRLKEYTDAALPATMQMLTSDSPYYLNLEKVALAESFRYWQKTLGENDPTVKAVLKGRTPADAAAWYVDNSKLANVDVRKQLANDAGAVEASHDSMIELARTIDPRARELRKRYDDKVDAILTESAGKIARARYDIYGSDEYPDATFSLRLTYGGVKGYKNDKGQLVPWTTDFAGMYKHATGKDPFKLPESWLKAKSKLDLKTPYNFVSTTDTHGGNSGSPTVNAKGEVIGILFDGNIEGLPNRFVFTDVQARSVHVASQGIVEGLRKVYAANPLVNELLGQ